MIRRLSALLMAIPLAIALTASQPAQAAGGHYGMGGCGVGGLIFQGDETKWKQIIASIVNDILGATQTFAITSGSSGCSAHHGDQASYYIKHNQDKLARDTVRGKGETLEALATIYGCQDSSIVKETLNRNFDKIFLENLDQEIDVKVRKALENDAAVTKSCNLLG